METFEKLLRKIQKREARIGIIGFGWVGLNLAVRILQQRFKVTGIDLSIERISDLQSLKNSESDKIKSFIDSKQLILCNDYKYLENIDIIIICIPIPADQNGVPNIHNISETLKIISNSLKECRLIILESTVYPGFCSEIAVPIFGSRGLVFGKDFYFSYSPERYDSSINLEELSFKNKLVSGMTESCIQLTREFYGTFTNTIAVNSIETAELTKLFENTFRLVNISFINEFAVICEKLNENIWEIIDSASTKPFGFMPFYPGPGVGGDCVPVASNFLSWKLNQKNIKSRLIESAQVINTYMPEYIFKRVEKLIPQKKLKVIVLGITYKRDIADIRGSCSIKLIEILLKNGIETDYNDPFIKEIVVNGDKKLFAKDLDYFMLTEYDCTVIATDHTLYNYEEIVKYSNKVFDTRNATKNVLDHSSKIELL